MGITTDYEERSVSEDWPTTLLRSGVPRKALNFCGDVLTGRDEYVSVIDLGAVYPDTVPPVVYLTGSNGNGKTHMGTWLFARWLLILAIRWLDNRSGWEPLGRWTTGMALSQSLKNFSQDGFDVQRAFGELTRKQLRLLMIDDVFADKATETDIANIAELVERRKNAGLMTILTGNKTVVDVEREYSIRLAERLLDGRVIRFAGKSHRLTGKME